jgi:TonB family protein
LAKDINDPFDVWAGISAGLIRSFSSQAEQLTSSRGFNVYCTTCNVDSANSLFCHVCDDYLPRAGAGTKANLVSRGFALVVDFVFYALLFLTAIWIFQASPHSLNVEREVPLKILIGLAIYLVVSLWPLSRGKTPGKFLMRIRVVDKRNSCLPGIGRMLVRETIGKVVSGAFLSLGYFWAIWDKDSQAWHDKIAGTVVLRQTAESDEYPLRFGDKVALGASAVAICICAILVYFNSPSLGYFASWQPSNKNQAASARTSTIDKKDLSREQAFSQSVQNSTTVPEDLQGTWVVKRYIPLYTGVGCFGEEEINSLVGTVIEYKANSIHWNDRTLPVSRVESANLSAEQFVHSQEPTGSYGGVVTFRDFGIQADAVHKITIEHPEVDLGWGDTSFPGDNGLLKTPTTLLYTVCNVWFEVEKQSAPTPQSLEVAKQDARLTTTYQRLIDQLTPDDEAIRQLRTEERDWIKQRDAQCGKDAACLAQVIKARTDELANKARADELAQHSNVLSQWNGDNHATEAMTGDVDVLEDSLRISRKRVPLQKIRELKGQELVQARKLLGGPDGSIVNSLYKTSVPSNIKFGYGSPLCSNDETTWIIILRTEGVMSMATMSGSSEPDLFTVEKTKSLCNIFSYTRDNGAISNPQPPIARLSGVGLGTDIPPGSGGVYHPGNGVSAPQVIYAPDPEFSDEAQRAKYQGICVVSVIADAQGNPQHVHVIRPLGMGLDEKAVEAVRQYKFRPATLQGHPVPVEVNIEVNFRRY